MKCPFTFSLFFILAAHTTSLNILLPLYVWVGTPDWNNALAAIDAYPTVQWKVIINPNSGPGTTAPSPSDPNYAAGIAQLNRRPNVQTLGYVDTGAGTKKPIPAVEAEVAVYASWAKSNRSDISIHGIYFDDVGHDDSDTVYDYVSAISAYTFDKMPSASTLVVYNPGCVAPSQLLSYGNVTVQFEASYADYGSIDPISQIPKGDLGKTAFQIYSTPTSDYGNIPGLVRTMAANGMEAVYFGSDCCYKTLDATLLMDLAKAVRDL